MRETYKLRIYPTKEQERRLLETLETCRWLYNHLLTLWRDKEKIPGRLELQAKLPFLKEEVPELRKVYSKTLQMVLYQLYSNLRTLSQLKKKGKKVGRLRFKGKGWFKTFFYNQSGFKIIRTGKRLDTLRLSKIGDIPMIIHREIEGKIKQVIIKKYPSGEWYACISTEKEEIKERKPVEKAIGIDVGIKHFLTDSEGRQVENPKFYKKSLERQRIEHKKLSKKKKGSNNRDKQRVKLAKSYEKIERQRDDFLHKLSKFYVDNYDLIAVEDLNIKGMVRNRNLAGKILDASWGKFLRMLSYKAENTGKIVKKVNPRKTSKEYKYGEIDRDYNASLNILERGLAGQGMPFVPVEMRPLLVIPASLIVEAGTRCLRLQS